MKPHTFKLKRAERCEYVVPRIRIRGGNYSNRYSLYDRYYWKPKGIHVRLA